MKLIATLLFGAALALQVFAMPPEPDPGAKPDPAAIADCTAKGGTMHPVGLGGFIACVIPYKDAGKDCTTGEACEGDCWINHTEDPGPDGKVHGQCQATNMPFGCHGKIEGGKIVDGILCAD